MDLRYRSLSSGAIARRTALSAMGAAGLGFALFGPRGTPTNSGNRLVLDYWEKWTSNEGEAMQSVVDAFNASQDRIFVRYIAIAGIDEKSQIAIAGGAPPDILGLWNWNIPAFAETGAIQPLDELGASFGVSPAIYSPGMAAVTTHKSRFYGAVNTGGTIALYYNKAHFREVGLDPEQPPRTIEELDEANRRLLKKNNAGDITRMGFHHREPGWWLFIWGYSFGGTLYDENADRALLDTPPIVAGYEWVRSYPREFGVNRLNEFRSSFGAYDTAQNAFLSGKISMVLQGPWLVNLMRKFNDGVLLPEMDYGVAPFPVAASVYDPARPIALVDSDVLVIPRGVKNPEASMEFIAYTQRQEVVEFLSTVHCKPSPLKQSSEKFLANHPNTGVRVFDALAKSPRSFRAPYTRGWPQIRDSLIWVFDESWNLKREPAVLLEEANQKTQGALDRFALATQRRAAERLK